MVYLPVSGSPPVHAPHFRSITWVFIHGMSFNSAYILLSGMSSIGQNPFILKRVMALVRIGKNVSGLYFFTVYDN